MDLSTLKDYALLLATLIPIFTAWLDSRRMQADVPQKIIESVSKAVELREKIFQEDFSALSTKYNDIESRLSHVLEYVEYLWGWITTHKFKNVKLPKTFDMFLDEKLKEKK